MTQSGTDPDLTEVSGSACERSLQSGGFHRVDPDLLRSSQDIFTQIISLHSRIVFTASLV